MIYLRGHLARPLDVVFCAASRMAVLRQLHGAQGGRSGRQIARLSGLNHQTVALALADLEKHGIVVRSAWGAQEVRWRLDTRRWVVTEMLAPLLAREVEHAESISAELKSRFKGVGRGILLYGDAAKGKLAPGKPLKLAVVGGGRAAADVVRGVITDFRERYGVAVEGKVINDSEAHKLAAFDDAWRLLPSEGRGWISH